ncbi:MBL fold metallo-hydrolase [Aliikangiella sp. IMCC44359]|uniref:MBL fold metallo-hydrolase n=1 Tax=Aliikangiella sp. IMCC44359 TaxID=3459125 RepID=UPI00403B340D
MSLNIQVFFHDDTFSLSYLVIDPITLDAVLIDPVMDFDAASASTSYASAQKILDVINNQKLTLKWVLETHAHADHLTSAQFFKEKTRAKIGIGKSIVTVQNTFNHLYSLTDQQAAKPEDFDRLLADKSEIKFGHQTIKILHTPGHTPSCSVYVINDCAFIGDTLFMPDFGTSRCDFPGGSASQLYHSIQKILALPEKTKLYMCHDYMPKGRELRWVTTVAEQKEKNIHIHQGVSEKAFVQLRSERDSQLAVPKLLLPALQINIRAGQYPKPEVNGTRYLKIPLNQF